MELVCFFFASFMVSLHHLCRFTFLDLNKLKRKPLRSRPWSPVELLGKTSAIRPGNEADIRSLATSISWLRE